MPELREDQNGFPRPFKQPEDTADFAFVADCGAGERPQPSQPRSLGSQRQSRLGRQARAIVISSAIVWILELEPRLNPFDEILRPPGDPAEAAFERHVKRRHRRERALAKN